MDDYIYMEFLIEDKSGSILIAEIMETYKTLYSDYKIYYKINPFKGLGKIPKKVQKNQLVKTGSLLNDLPSYLRGLNKVLRNCSGRKAIFVVLDTDNQNCAELKKSLVLLKDSLELDVNVYFCLAIEEMESWLLGDENALQQAFPNYKRQIFTTYEPDSLVGTWEFLADVVYLGGRKKLEKEMTSYYEIGKQKCIWAKEIGQQLNLLTNRSPSFNYFISKLDSVCNKNIS